MTLDCREVTYHSFNTYIPTDFEIDRFNTFQVELLLNQAADLLDRAQHTESLRMQLLARHWEQKIAYDREIKELEILKTKLLDLKIRFPENYGREYDFEGKKVAGPFMNEPDILKEFNAFKAREKAAYAQAQGVEISYHSYGSVPNSVVENRRAKWEHIHNHALYELEKLESEIFELRYNANMARLVSQNEFMGENKAFDFIGQACKLVSLIERDRNDAFVRQISASKGLKHIYGDAYKEWAMAQNLPELPKETKELEPLILWNRNIIAFLNAFSQMDQGFNICLSLKDSLIGGWDDWLAASYENAPFQINPDYLKDFKYIRIRGVSAVLISKKHEINPWKLTIAPPINQYYQTKSGLINSLSQIKKNVVIGRVEDHNSLRMPDLAGMMTLYNLSPGIFQKDKPNKDDYWHVSAEKPKRSIDNSQLEDIRLEIALIGQPN